MTSLSDLNVYLNLLKEKEKNRLSVSKYGLKVNKYLTKILKKLKKMEVIKELKIINNVAYFKPDNLIYSKFYEKPTETLNQKDYRKVIKQKLKDSIYNTLLISTSEGLKTLKESVLEKKGGYIIGFITGKRPIYKQ